MSRLSANVSTAHYSIRKWRGVNECPDGDAGLKDGEAAAMRNFRVTDGGALKKRPGTKNIVGLSTGYVLSFGQTGAVLVEMNAANKTFTAYPTCQAESDGSIKMTGTAAEVNFDNAPDHEDYFFSHDGFVYRLRRVEYSTSNELAVDKTFAIEEVEGGYIAVGDQRNHHGHFDKSEVTASHATVGVENGNLIVGGAKAVPGYVVLQGDKTKGARVDMESEEGSYYLGVDIKYVADHVYTWYGELVTATSNEANAEVKALWSGYVAGEKRFVAACSGTLWELKESGGTWVRSVIGYLNTDGAVSLFGMNDNLYALDGEKYQRWNGTTFAEVAGYIPTVVTATAPAGGGQTLERVNKLTLRRRQLFSADGQATVFQLAETQIAGVDSVSVDGTKVSPAIDKAAGTLTFATAPLEGQNNIEVIYTASLSHYYAFATDGESTEFTLPVSMENGETVTGAIVWYLYKNPNKPNDTGTETTEEVSYELSGNVIKLSAAPESGRELRVTVLEQDPRKQVLAMRYAEFFNGGNDNRVFVYGDGSNKAFYSGVDRNGKPTAEYFPDLNEAAFGDNSPITAMCRHYNRLLVFKEDSTHSAYYNSVTLADGTVTAGFYVSSVNKDIGNVPKAQAVLVENRVRTMDGKSVYEWRSTNTSGNVTNDQRNAQRVSQRVEKTLAGFDFETAVCWFDKIRHEYYCVSNGTAVVQNTENDTWYVYTEFPAVAMALHADELYVGTPGGWVRHVSEEYGNDNGIPVVAYWESGSLSFDRDYVRKYSPTVWLSFMGENDARMTVGVFDDGGNADGATVEHVGGKIASTHRARLRAWRFSHFKLTFAEESSEKTAALQTATVEVRYNADVKRR